MSSVPVDNNRSGKDRRQELMRNLQYLGQMASTETALFHQTAAAKNGLGITDVKTMSVLMQEGAMTAGQIASRLSLTTGAVTNVIDRLEKHGLVQRSADATDRRKVIVRVNAQNPHLKGDNVYTSVAEAFAKLMHGYSTEQLEFLERYFLDSIELTKQEIAKLATTD